MARLPEFLGSKIQPRLASRSAATASQSSRVGRHVGGVVCEAQETAVKVPAVIDAIWQSLVFYDGTPVLVEILGSMVRSLSHDPPDDQ